MSDMYLNPAQVIEKVKEAERADETIIIRCVRKTKASKPGGPGIGDLQDIHCMKKPPYTPKTNRDRVAEDTATGTLTVYATSTGSGITRDENGNVGSWRRINVEEVKKVIYKGKEYEVKES